MELRNSDLCFCLSVAWLWQTEVFALLLSILVAFDTTSFQLVSGFEFFEQLHDDVGVWSEPESRRNAVCGGSKEARKEAGTVGGHGVGHCGSEVLCEQTKEACSSNKSTRFRLKGVHCARVTPSNSSHSCDHQLVDCDDCAKIAFSAFHSAVGHNNAG